MTILRVFAMAMFVVSASSAQEAAKPMAADAHPSFEVATVKASAPEAKGNRLARGARNFTASNFSLGALVQFAYSVQAKQVAGGPAWVDTAKFDLAGVPDVEGVPSVEQNREMLRKLLTERFKLKVHHEQRELPAYVLTVAKGGPKLTRNESGLPGPGNTGIQMAKSGIVYMMKNETMAEFTGVLQEVILDRPVLDRTGLTDRYDARFTFAATGTEFGGMAPPAGDDSMAPSLFTVMPTLGLKLEALKTAVDVVVIDGVEMPSAN